MLTPVYSGDILRQVQEYNSNQMSEKIILKEEIQKANEEIKRVAEEECKSEYKFFRVKPADSTKIKEWEALRATFRMANHQSEEFIGDEKYFQSAKTEILRMLNGDTALSLKRAVFLCENAWYGSALSYKDFCQQIDQEVWTCRQVLKYYKLSDTEDEDVHFAIHHLFHNVITLPKASGGVRKIYPFSYDTNDFMGDENRSNLFVSKLLKTRKGQCHSLPLLYLILSQELKAEAYLTLAPAHSYIKFPMGGQLYSYECTNGLPVSDDWIMASGYISPVAIRNKIYLAPQSAKETIAQCLLDLASCYQNRFGYDDFVLNCIQKVNSDFPSNITALQHLSNYYTALFLQEAEAIHYPAISEIEWYPGLNNKYKAMLKFRNELEQKGYVRIPEEEYKKWVKHSEDKATKPNAKESAQLNKKNK
ncbi:MAG: hypothetical protein ACKOXB_00950 [Flavobacteriales bacterium]